MSIEYRMIHTNFKTLAEDVKAMVKAYDAGEISDSDVDEILNDWTKHCPNLLYEDVAQTVVAYSLSRIIGKKRATVLSAAFRRRAN